MTKDARIDAFIDKAQPFAKTILTHLRKLVHAACPEVEETIKWGMPNFGYKGMLCGLGAFKQHCAFNLFKAKLMKDSALFEQNNADSMGQLGRITSLQDLPPDDVMIAYIQEAAKLNEKGAKPVKAKTSTADKVLSYPAAMANALAANTKANEMFEKMSYSHKKEYAEWISEAKTETTQNKRIATMLEWLEEGKRRNWKHERK